jgi:hypothetical protein
MEQPRTPAWWDNPLALGAVGILVMVIGYLATGFRLPTADSADARQRDMMRAGAAKIEQNDPEAAAALRSVDAPAQSLPFLWAGRLVFLVGLGVVVFAAVRWRQMAQRPDEPESPGEEAELDEVA